MRKQLQTRACIATAVAALTLLPVGAALPEMLEPEPLGTSCSTSSTCTFSCGPSVFERVRVSGSALLLFSITGSCGGATASCSSLLGGCSASSPTFNTTPGTGRCSVSGISASGTCASG